MRVNICGIQHDIIEMDDNFDLDFHFGQIDYKKNEIRINKALTNEGKKEAICHEMLQEGWNEDSDKNDDVPNIFKKIFDDLIK